MSQMVKVGLGEIATNVVYYTPANPLVIELQFITFDYLTKTRSRAVNFSNSGWSAAKRESPSHSSATRKDVASRAANSAWLGVGVGVSRFCEIMKLALG